MTEKGSESGNGNDGAAPQQQCEELDKCKLEMAIGAIQCLKKVDHYTLTIEVIKETDSITAELSNFTDAFINSLKQPDEFLDLIAKQYCFYYECVMKLSNFDKVFDCNIQTNFNNLHGYVEKLLGSSHTTGKNLHSLKEHFIMLQDSCNNVTTSIEKRLNELNEDAKRLFEIASFQVPKGIGLSYSDCITKIDSAFWDLEQIIDLTYECENFICYLKNVTKAISLAEALTKATLQCVHFHQFGVISSDEDLINFINFYHIVSFIGSDSCNSSVYRQDQNYVMNEFFHYAELVIKDLPKDITMKIESIKASFQNSKQLLSCKKIATELESSLSVLKRSNENPKFYEKLFCILQNLNQFLLDSTSYWSTGHPPKSRIKLNSEFIPELKLQFHTIQVTNFEMKLQDLNQSINKPQQPHRFVKFYSCQQSLHSLYFLKQLEISFQTFRECYEKIKEYEDASITAITDVLSFSCHLDDKESLDAEIYKLKKALISYCFKNSTENFQAVSLLVNLLIEIVQKVVNSSSVFEKGDVSPVVLENLIRPKKDDLLTTCVILNFEVIVRKEDWNLKTDMKPIIAMAFHIPNHGDILLQLEFKPLRDEATYSIFSSSVAIKNRLRGAKLYYKYLLFPFQHTPMELIFIKKAQNVEAEKCYRVIHVPYDKKKVLFDSCIFPQEPVKDQGMISKFWHGKSLKMPDSAHKLDFCAAAHLRGEYDDIEQCKIGDINQVLDKIMSVYDSSFNAKKANILDRKEVHFYDPTNASEIIQDQLEYLLYKVELSKQPSKVLSGLVLCHCLVNVSNNLSRDVQLARKILSILVVSYDEDHLCCPEFDYVKSAINNPKILIESLRSCILKSGSKNFALILEVLPLYHWFYEESPSSPFFQLNYDVKSLCQMFEGQDKRILNLSVDSRSFDDAIAQLKPVQIKGDPLLQVQLVKVSPDSSYKFLVDFVNLQIMLVDLGIKLKSPQYQSQKRKVREIIAVVSFLWQKKHIFSFDPNVLEFLQFFLLSLGSITKILCALNKEGRDAVVASFKMLLYAIDTLESHEKERELQQIVPLFIENWAIVNNGENFLSGVDIQKEHQFWVDLYAIGDQSLEWKEILRYILFNRFEKINDFVLMVEVFEKLMTLSSDHDIIDVTRDCLVKHATSANNKELQILAKGSSKAKSILISLIDLKFPTLPDSIETLLEWDMWPTILIALTVNTSSHKSQNICQHMKGILEDFQNKVKSGDVTVEILLQLKMKWNTHLVQIVSALLMDQQKLLDDIQFAIKKIHTFKIFVMILKEFASSVIIGLPSLLAKINNLLKNHEKSFLNSLCSYSDVDGWIFPSFPEAKMITPMIVQFTIMSSEELKNDIFYFKLQQLAKNIAQNSSFENINCKLWVPLFDYCCTVADELKGETISLRSLSMIFGGTESADTEKTIKKLSTAVQKCHAQCTKDIDLLADLCTENDIYKLVEKIEPISSDLQWVKIISKKITEWSNVQALSSEADELMKAFKTYDLDTSLVCQFTKKEIQKFLDTPLNSVTDGAEKMLLVLKSSRHVTKEIKESILILGNCKSLRNFIKRKSKDVSEMERFIQIALDIVAGDGENMQNQLIYLSELCAKFYPLLYQLDCSTNQDVPTLFQQTWESLKTHNDPLTLTKLCVSSLDWYRSIGELQNAGEKKTVQQLGLINKHGEYTLSTTKYSQECRVSLVINSDDFNVSKKFWTLDELHEIESTLVLITRQDSSWVKPKELFQEMLNKVCQICDAVQKLKEYGHMNYLEYLLTLPCSDFVDDIKILNTKIEELEQILSSWIGYVWRCRHRYSELNFYKTNQLIVLREELTKVKENEHHKINLQVFCLLNSAIGKPLESEFVVRKALKGDSLDDESSGTVKEFDTTESAAQPVQPVKENFEPEEISKVSQSFTKVKNDESMNKLYEELAPLGYKEFLILQALLIENISDVFEVMEWLGDLSRNDTDKYKKEWMVNDVETKKSPLSTTEPPSDSSVDSSAELFEVDIDISHMANYFFKSIERSTSEKTTSFFDGTNYISLETLGRCLQTIATRQESLTERNFLKPFEQGTPNLVITSSDNIFNCTLQIYSAGENKSLPTFDEVFLCSESTTLEEVTIFWMRVLGNQKNNQIYCLLHGEKLLYLVAEESLDLLKFLSQGNKEYKLVIICSDEEEGKSNIISRLYSYRREWNLPTPEDIEHLKKFLWQNVAKINKKSYIAHVDASDVDIDHSHVRVFTSKQAGAGKSISVRKLKDELVRVFRKKGLISEKQTQKAIVTLPLHGPEVTADEVLTMLLNEDSDLKSCIIHIDIPIRVLQSIDDIIFSLLILGGLTDSKGNVWRSHPSQLYAIELTLPSTKSYIWEFSQTRRAINLLKLFPNTECLTPKQLCDSMTNDSAAIELRTPMYQRVYQYLQLLEQKKYSKLEKFIFVGTLEGSDKECLDTIIRHSNISIPTWKEVRHFVWFLNIQLSACEQSNIIKRVPGLRTFVVDFMTTMSRDFATSSMSTESAGNILNQHLPRRRWDESMHPYLFFNKDRTSVTHVGLQFKRKGSQIVLQDTYTQKEIKTDIAPELFEFLTKSVKIPIQNTSNYSENELIERLLEFMNIKTDKIESPDDTYVLTQDNLTKIMAIQTRFRCQIPVVLMGETGCGKTHLIRFMCKFAAYNVPSRFTSPTQNQAEPENRKTVKNMFILKVHGGTTEEDVIQCLEEAKAAALENRKHKIDTVVFFDEANTSDVISLIKEIMCDGRCRGKLVPPFLKFVAACNPYRKHSDEMIKKLRGAGLGWRDKEASNNAEKLGEIPLRDLVYRVLELPDSMKALIYDFGQLKYKTERDYIIQMTHNKLQKKDKISYDCVIAIAEVLANCQDLSKQMKDECSFVSLRDVDRALVLFIYFLEVFTDVFQINNHNNVDKITQSLLLALSIAYLARMASRDAFLTEVLRCLKPPLHPVDLIEYKKIVKKYQEKLLDCMEIENNIAKNAALRENIFMMFVCIELRIPLFLVGKPGSSKSLAKAIIENSLKGKNSKNPKMKNFEQVHLHSHQCSGLSTPASITKVFHEANNFQDKRDTTTFVSVVVLDEVGLAEASPYLPLKALHPLLEDGTDGSGSDDQRISREKRVAFIGISNWALDPAKMNRGIMVTRTEPGILDLTESAVGICSDKGQDDLVLKRLKQYFPKLASAYIEICKEQKREFFGLRDFYSLIKMLYWMSEETGSILTRPQLEHAVRRNFSGFDEFDTVAKFQDLKDSDNVQKSSCAFKQFKNNDVVMLQCYSTGEFLSINEKNDVIFISSESRNAQFIIHIKEKSTFSLQSIHNNSLWLKVKDSSNLVIDSNECFLHLEQEQDKKAFLICASQKKCSTQYHLVAPDDPITNPDCSSLGLISTSLSNKKNTCHGESRYLLFLTQNYSSLQVLKHYIVTKCLQDFNTSQEGSILAEPFVLFGSSFPRDKEFAQVCRNISEIRLCMESGRMVILLNLENLYESLYDVLNQYYVKSGDHRYVDLGLRNNRVKCIVHDNFKLVLIAERERVYQEFPTPLINRLEKHFVDATTVLQSWQKDVCNQLDTWIETFLIEKFTREDAFIGYSSDTNAAVVLQATYLADSENDVARVLEISKRLLLQIASPDAIVRSICNKEYQQIYFVHQEHSSLADLIKRIPPNSQILLQVTTHTSTLTQSEFEELGNRIEMKKENMTRIHLEAFQTEQDFVNTIDKMIKKGKSHEHYVIFECERVHEKGNLISCCRYRLTDKFNQAAKMVFLKTKFVLLLHMPKKCLKSNFVSFQEHPWLCYHVDAIFSTENSVSLNQILSGEVCSMSDIYYDDNDHALTNSAADDSDSDSQLFKNYQLLPCSEPQRINLCKRMYLQISKAASNPEQVDQLSQIIPQKIPFPLAGEKNFHSQTVHLIKRKLSDQEFKNAPKEWIQHVSMNMTELQEAGTFQNAVVRRFDDTIIPIFSKIISIIDKHSNLKLLSSKTQSKTKIDELEQLWLSLYNSNCVTELIMSKLQSTTNDANAASKMLFSCKFPFSWILIDIVNENLNKDTEEVLSLLQDYHLLFEILPENFISSLARFYVHDFVHLLDTKGQPVEKDYYEVLENCMIVMSDMPFSDELNVTSLFQIVINVQRIYFSKKLFFDLFSELIMLVPSTVKKLKMKSKPDESNIQKLLVDALEIVLDSPFLDVQAPLKSEKEVSLQGWMQKQYESHKIISNIVEECKLPLNISLKWQWVCVMKFFFEYVVLQNPKETIIFARRIKKFSEKITNFQNSNTLKIVAFLLSGIEKDIEELEAAEQQMIKKSCWSFFLEVLSSLCIDENNYDEELIDTLIQAIFSNTQNVKDKLCKYLENHIDELTYLQSFTIKLIMQYEYNTIQSKLDNIMEKISSRNIQSFIEIFLANIKTTVSVQDEEMIFVAENLLGEGHKLLMQYKNEGALSPQCWLAVAKLTKGQEVLAKKIHESVYSSSFDMDADAAVAYLFSEAKKYCQSADLNDHQTTEGPFWYLIRYIIRTFGSMSLMKIFKNSYFKWILPSENFRQDEKFMDIVAVYNPTYQDIRSAISRATTGDFDELNQAVTSLDSTFTVPLALALFERVRFSYATDIPSRKISNKIIGNFISFAKTCHLFTKDQEVLHIVEELIRNQQCSVFPSMQARKDEHEDSIYQMIVVHSVLTVLVNRKTRHIRMLSHFLSSPKALKDFLLPAMPIKLSSIKEEDDSFLQCNNGHQYTDIMLESFCIHCGRIIQYCKSLGPVDKLDNEASPGYIPLTEMEQNPPTGFLSSASYTIIRCIMHSCLLWSSCNEKNISPLINGKLPCLPEYLFFWDEIKKDIQQLSSITGHSIDEAALLVHLVLKQINDKGHRVQLTHQTGQNVVGNLVQLDDRQKWEEQFYDCYMESVVKDTNCSIQKILKELTTKDYSKIFGAVYITPMMTSEPFLWNVYPTLTSQQIFGQLMTIKLFQKHPVIFTYLSEVRRFEAMQFLPDILKMLKITQNAISQLNFDEKTQETIENMSFSEFVNQILTDDRDGYNYKKYFDSFQYAWKLCYHELNDGRLFELKNDRIQVKISKETKMKYLIPTTYGPGVITTGLIDHLVISHNKFIRLCRKFVKDALKKEWLWQSPKVPLQELNSEHFVKCSDEFVRLVQSHSVYTISNGNITIQINDLRIIERDFVQEFALGKPIITHVLNIPQVIWKRPVHNTQIIAAVKKNISQQPLPPQVRSEILMDLKDDLAKMTVICETVETAMRFLQIKKESARKKLKEYVENDLNIIGKLRSEKITDFCCLQHVVSLWRLLNVERAKYKFRNEEDPFSVKPDFMEELDDEQQKVSLEIAISKMTNIDNMLEVMYEMIQTYVQTCGLEDKKKQLIVVLSDYVLQTKSEPISHLMELFPPEIELCQVVCTWKEIVRLQDATKKKIR